MEFTYTVLDSNDGLGRFVTVYVPDYTRSYTFLDSRYGDLDDEQVVYLAAIMAEGEQRLTTV